jgi:hypothetical protein
VIIEALQPDVLVKGADWAADASSAATRWSARREGRAHADRERLVDICHHRTSQIRIRPIGRVPPRTMLHHTSSLALRALFKSAAVRAGLHRTPSSLTGLCASAVAYHAAWLPRSARCC